MAAAEATLCYDEEAGDDDTEYETAFSAYLDARQHLLDVKKARGFEPVTRSAPRKGKGKRRPGGPSAGRHGSDSRKGESHGDGRGKGHPRTKGRGRSRGPPARATGFFGIAEAGPEPAVDYAEQAFSFMTIATVSHDWYFSENIEDVPELPATEGVAWMACTPGYAVLDSGCTLSCVGDASLEGYMRRCSAETGSEPQSFNREVLFEGIGKKPVKSSSGLSWPVSLFKKGGSLKTQIMKDSRSPMLISQNALETLGAVIDHGRHLLYVEKLSDKPLQLIRSKAGHLLLPLWGPRPAEAQKLQAQDGFRKPPEVTMRRSAADAAIMEGVLGDASSGMIPRWLVDASSGMITSRSAPWRRTRLLGEPSGEYPMSTFAAKSESVFT